VRRLLALFVLAACRTPTTAAVLLAAPPAPSAVPPVAPARAPAEPVRVLYRGAEPAWAATTLPNGRPWTRSLTWLQGVDAAGRRAWVTHEPMNDTGEFELVDVDLATGDATTWAATEPDARMRAFHPLTGTVAGDLARYADMVEATGPFVVRARDYAGPHLAVSKDRVVYEADPDRLMIAWRDGSHARRFGGGHTAAYEPIFSADGSHVAFDACDERAVVPPGAFYRCVYHVYVARIDGAPVETAVTQPQPPTFGADGRFVYAASRDDDHASEPHDRGGCADRVDVATGSVTALACRSDLYDVDLETGERAAVFHGMRGKPGEQIGDFEWLELPSGKRLGTFSVDRGTGSASYGGGDFLFASSQHGIVVIDLRTRREVVLPVPMAESIWLSKQWRDHHTVYALRSKFGERAYEILAIDARALLGE
jgi:hypothetical protein